MALIVRTRKVEGVVVIDVNGRLTCGEPQMLLRNTIRQFIDDGNRRLVLNLSEVSFVDSSGLGELISTENELTSHNGQVNLLGLKKRVRDVLVLTKLVCVFDCYDKESEAVLALLANCNANGQVGLVVADSHDIALSMDKANS